jgi:hypothetical protein
MIAWAYNEFLIWLHELFQDYAMFLIIGLVVLTLAVIVQGAVWLWRRRPGRRRRHRGL